MFRFLRLTCLFLLVVAAWLPPDTANAFSISPLRFEITIDPGKSQVMRVKIKNTENTSQNFAITVSGVSQDAAGRPIFTTAGAETTWIKPENKIVAIKPGAAKEATALISVPAGTTPGARYVAVLITPTRGPGETVAVGSAAAVLLKITVAGVVHESVSIEHWSAEGRITSHRALPLAISLKNNGTVAAALEGTIITRPWWGAAHEEKIYIGNELIAGAVRSVKPHITLPSRLPGPYQLQLIVRYGRSHSVATALTTVWYFPYYFIGIAALALGAIGYGLYRAKRKK